MGSLDENLDYSYLRMDSSNDTELLGDITNNYSLFGSGDIGI